MKQIVYVVAWEYETGGGFDWYHTPEAQAKAFEAEKQNCVTLKKEGWKCYRFAFETELTEPEAITEQIDAQLNELCDACQPEATFSC